MLSKATICALINTISFISLMAQTKTINYPDSKDAPGKTAVIFAPQVISTAALQHSAPAFSPDGKSVLWSNMKLPSYQTYLLEMNFVNGSWSQPHVPSFSDTTVNEVYPCFSAGGDTLIFSSDRKQNDTMDAAGNTLWFVTKQNGTWSQAKPLHIPGFKNGIYAVSVTKYGKLYFTAGAQGDRDWNICAASPNSAVAILPQAVNTTGYEDGPFIAPDESYLIFESDRPGKTDGGLDLYITFKRNDGTWTEALNMGPEVNTKHAERFAKVSPDGRYLFFGRNTGNGFDIYWINASIIGDLRKQVLPSEPAANHSE